LPLFGVGPSFNVFKTKRVAVDDQGSARTVPTLNSSRRLTSRCSGRGDIKCSAAGGRAESAHERWRARVLNCWRAAAELGS
jgi:hypothetical protein